MQNNNDTAFGNCTDHVESVNSQSISDLDYNEQRFLQLGNNLPFGVLFRGVNVQNKGFKMLYASPNISKVLALNQEQLSENIEAFKNKIHPDDLAAFLHKQETCRTNQSTLEVELRYFFSENNLRWLFIRAHITASVNDTIYWDGYIFDVTDKNLFQQTIKDSERNFKNIFNASTDSIIIHQFDGEIITFNQEFSRFISNNDVANKTIFDFFEIETISQLDYKQNLEENLKIPNSLVALESVFFLSPDISIPVEVKSRAIEYNNNPVALTMIRDISLRKDLEKKLLNTIVETEEKERQRLAIDLHDEIGPLLSSMKMYVQLLKTAKDLDKIDYISTQVLELVKEAITATREISNSLSPHVLSNYGLIAAMNNMMDNIRPFIPVQFKTNCDTIRFDENIETVYYRIFKELSNNTLKHAKAKKIEISLKYANSTLYLHYSDDGVGFSLDEKLTSKKDGIGLFNILSRVQAINGEYVINTNKGQGFQFELKTKTKTK